MHGMITDFNNPMFITNERVPDPFFDINNAWLYGWDGQSLFLGNHISPSSIPFSPRPFALHNTFVLLSDNDCEIVLLDTLVRYIPGSGRLYLINQISHIQHYSAMLMYTMLQSWRGRFIEPARVQQRIDFNSCCTLCLQTLHCIERYRVRDCTVHVARDC